MTRNLPKIMSLVVALASLVQADAVDVTETAPQRISLALVFDSSPTSGGTWRQMKAVACDAVDHLQEGDRILILRARDGDPVLHTDAIVRPSPAPGPKNLHACIRSIRQVFFLSKADVAKAVAAAFDDLSQQPESYRRCLLVVSAGHLSRSQVGQIRRLAGAYRFHGWPVGFLVREDASRDLFRAASQGEFDVMFLDAGDVPGWLDGMRRPQAETERPTENGREPQEETEPAKPAEPPQPEEKEKVDEPRPAPADVEPRVEPKEAPSDRSNGQRDPNRSGLSPDAPDPTPDPCDPVPDTARKRSWLRSVLAYEYVLAIVVGGLVVGLVLLGVLATKAGGSPDGPGDFDEYGADDSAQKLLCSTGDQEYDLGEEEHIHTLVIGKGVTSAVPLMDDQELEDEHVEITRRRNGYRIKNRAEQPIVVDGTAVKKNGKLELMLPATIELTPQTRIMLSRAPVMAAEPTMPLTGEDHENDDI